MTGDAPALYGLIGHPVEHSRSPLIHRLFAEQTGRHMNYVLIDAVPGRFRAEIEDFRARKGQGLNVTLPFKGDAFRFCARSTQRARQARAVNTIAWKDGEAFGDNTDGAGLVRDLEGNLGLSLRGSRILLIGAGGAARGAVGAIIDADPAELIIANRTPDRAASLAEAFSSGGLVRADTFENLHGGFDLIINATSASLSGQVPAVPAAIISPRSFCYDMMYGKNPTAFLSWASAHGAGGCADGVGMLVEQAAESFLLWRNLRPDTGPVLREVRRRLS